MNYLCARQRQDGRWDYTRNGLPTGYCRKHVPIPEDGNILSVEFAKKENQKMDLLKDNFHTDGHASKEEACECQKKYQLDAHLRLEKEEPSDASQQFRCQICKNWTACHAWVGAYRVFCLCPEHQTRECLESLFQVGESWES